MKEAGEQRHVDTPWRHHLLRIFIKRKRVKVGKSVHFGEWGALLGDQGQGGAADDTFTSTLTTL